MKRLLLRNVAFYTRNILKNPYPCPFPAPLAPSASTTRPRLRFYSSENDSSGENPTPAPETSLATSQNKDSSLAVEDVSNKGKTMVRLICLVAE